MSFQLDYQDCPVARGSSKSNTLNPVLLPQCDFDSLDPEELSSTVGRFGKSVHQLEKGLPSNHVVPKLKERVEGMREKVHITMPCSPSHFMLIYIFI